MLWLAKVWWSCQNTPSESQELGKRKNYFNRNGKLHDLLHSLLFLKHVSYLILSSAPLHYSRFPLLKYFYSINLCSFAKQLSENMPISYSSVATLVSPSGNILGRGTWTSTLNDNLFMLTRDWQYIVLDFKQRKYLTWILKSKV